MPFKVPYPVPFRLLGDEAKGWLDTTYLSPSGNLRISRGNKVNYFTFLGYSNMSYILEISPVHLAIAKDIQNHCNSVGHHVCVAKANGSKAKLAASNFYRQRS